MEILSLERWMDATLEDQIRAMTNEPFVFGTETDRISLPPDLDDKCVRNRKAQKLITRERLCTFDLLRIHDLIAGSNRTSTILKEISGVRKTRLRFVITTRHEADMALPRSFQRLCLEPMGDLQMTEFFTRWLSERPNKATEVLSFLDKNDHIRDVCRTPMVASIVASLAAQDLDLPKTRTEVYTRRSELLLERWAFVKHVNRPPLVPVEDKKHFLSTVALGLHTAHKRHFSKRFVERIWVERYAHSYTEIAFDSFFEELLVYNGVLRHEGGKYYSLGHLSFQEYLAALGVMYQQRINLLLEHVSEAWWRQVLVFYAGLTKQADRIVERLMDRHGLPMDDALLQDLRQEARLSAAVVSDFMRDISEELNDSDE
jgi:hypothetical protein